MLKAALPAGSLAPKHMDTSTFSAFDDFEQLEPEARAVVAADEGELRALAGYPAISGHFSLPSLATFAPPSKIGTVLREPRSRLVSYYVYLRLTPALRTLWRAYGVHTAAEGTLAEFLANPRVATSTDNRTCRMLLHGDPRIRDREFIADDDLEPIAEAAWARLEELGFVGILEVPAETWRGLGEFFGVELEPVRENVTRAEAAHPGMLPLPSLGGPETLDLLELRSAADAILYRRIVARLQGGAQAARRLADAAFAQQLVRYGAFTSAGATEAEEERQAHAETRRALEACTEKLERSDAMLETVWHSRSWRLTAPLRRTRRKNR